MPTWEHTHRPRSVETYYAALGRVFDHNAVRIHGIIHGAGIFFHGGGLNGDSSLHPRGVQCDLAGENLITDTNYSMHGYVLYEPTYEPT